MRSRGHFWVVLVLSAAFSFPSSASAETIRISSGFFNIGTGSGPYRLIGDRRGFTLFGRISTDFAHFSPLCDDFVGCRPGTVAQMPHQWTGLDFPGPQATLDGVFYEIVNSLSDEAFAGVLFSSTTTLPAFDGRTATTLRTPFTMTGGFSIWPDEGEIREWDLAGSGILTTTWSRVDSQWEMRSARYDFTSAPVPEPTTLVLAGIAGAAAALARRRRRTH